jgi:hypothetical protein
MDGERRATRGSTPTALSPQITKPAEAIAATGSGVFTHLPRLFGYLAEAPLTPTWRFDLCCGYTTHRNVSRVASVANDTLVTLRN